MEMGMARALTRDALVRQEGAEAARRSRSRKDNPYRPGSADWRAWCDGFGVGF